MEKRRIITVHFRGQEAIKMAATKETFYLLKTDPNMESVLDIETGEVLMTNESEEN